MGVIGNTYRRLDLSGQAFGWWTVLQFCKIDKHQRALWDCQCLCGDVHPIPAETLRRGGSTRCQKCSRSENPKIRLRPYEALYRKSGRSAKRDNHEFTITYEQFAELASANSCHYCQSSVSFAMHCVVKNGQAYQLDRMDNSKGYVPGNVVVCCKRCNHAKGNRFTYSEWWAMTECFRSGRMPIKK